MIAVDKRPIRAEELGNFQLDQDNKLYWSGKPIKSENVTLSLWQKIFAFVVAASAVLASLTTFNQEFCWVPYGKTCQSTTAVQSMESDAGGTIQPALPPPVPGTSFKATSPK